MSTTSLTPGQRIVWGSGELPGVYNGPSEVPGFVSVRLDTDFCSITVTTDSVGHAR
ncbi:hypothetical protein ACF1BP_21625 [Streptomyces sp. NPDC014735]|uniref:hypothetical protein n=1 Tax=Streptomyces sp. NPDC014735 TaxID=3364887 RepID=UPI0036F72666